MAMRAWLVRDRMPVRTFGLALPAGGAAAGHGYWWEMPGKGTTLFCYVPLRHRNPPKSREWGLIGPPGTCRDGMGR